MGYFYETRTKAGTYVATIPGNQMQGEWFMNKADQIRFSLPLFDEQVTREKVEEGVHEIWLYRDDLADPIFAGPLWELQISSQDRKLDCAADGIESYFDFRRVDWDLAYNLWERGEIAWDLINRSQLMTDGGLGITKGTVQVSGSLTNQKYLRNEGIMIGDVLKEFSELKTGGFDWEIDNASREFNSWTPRRGTATPLATLEYGEDSTFTRYAVGYDGKYMSNDVLLTGPEGSFSVTTVDTTKRTKYGLIQRKEEHSEARIQQDLVDKADYILQVRKQPKITPTIVLGNIGFDPFDGPYSFGDVFQVVIDDGYVQYDTPMRYVGFQMALAGQDQTSINMYLNDLREVEDL